jgi:hypothetical protein
VCPYYLDGDLAQHDPEVTRGPVIPVFSRRLSMAADVASVQFSRTVKRRKRRPVPALVDHVVYDVPSRGPADAGLSKLNSMLDHLRPRTLGLPK